jgi:predicted nucleic acid-binding protein
LIVLDASLIIAHVLGESTIAVDSSIFDTLKGDRVTVPAHWSAEVASALTNNARRGRLSQADITLVLKQIDVFDIEFAKPPSAEEMSNLIAFATEKQLTAYDAAYVMLASRLGAKLATSTMRCVVWLVISISTCCRLELSSRNIRPPRPCLRRPWEGA